jgi:branched-chain amino acid transport system ATP-binding protein
MLSVQGVSKHFGGLRAVEDVSFDVDAGSITAVIGPNGAGKTTLFNVVTGVLKPTAGRILFNGTDISKWPAHRIASAGMGRTFQNIQLFANLNVLENVMAARICRTRATMLESLFLLPRDRSERRRSREFAEELLNELGIYERRFLMPRELPYGDQRRAEVARALATNPTMLMLDEPSAGMTHREGDSFMQLVAQLNERGRTIFLIEHNMRLVMTFSQKIVVLNFGTKIAEGAPQTIQSDAAVLEAYLGTRT